MSARCNLAFLIATVLILGSHGKSTNTAKEGETRDELGVLGTRPVLKSPGVGSINGTKFDDLNKLANSILTIRSMTIAAFYEVDSLQFSYTLKDGSIYRPPTRGKGFTVPQTIKLANDEYVAKIEGTTVYNNSVSQVFITIKSPNRFKSRIYSSFGMYVGERNFVFEGYILGIHGKTGPRFNDDIVRNLGVYYLAPVKQSEYFGSSNITFLENPDARFPPVVKINKLFISHGDRVNSLQAEYQLLSGDSRLGDKNGGDGDSLTAINLNYGEELVGLKGMLSGGTYSSIDQLTQLTLISRKKDGSTKVYGPFGKAGGKSFSVTGHILGFTGKASNFIESLSVFYYV